MKARQSRWAERAKIFAKIFLKNIKKVLDFFFEI